MLGMFPMSGLNTPEEEPPNPFDLSYVYEMESNSSFDDTLVDFDILTEITDITETIETTEITNSVSNYDDSISTTDSEDSIVSQEMENAEPRDQIRKLKGLVARLAKGFDAGSFPESVQDCIPQLAGILFPGSYAHLLVILLVDFGLMEGVQVDLFQRMADEFPEQLDDRAHAVTGLDGGLFVSELRVLRKMLAPLRGDNSDPIYWLGSRIENPPATYHEVKLIIETIEKFKDDLLRDIQGPNDNRTIYDPRGNFADYSTEACIREFRMDACRASLRWGEYFKSDVHLSSFHRAYVSDMIENDPDRARDGGFLPPAMPEVPEYRPFNPDSGRAAAICDWEQEDLQGSVLDLILKIAVWLGLSRNVYAVMIFCDIVRAFSLKCPSETTHRDRIALLYTFSMLRIASDHGTPGTTTPESDDGDGSYFNDSNPWFLADVNNRFNLDFHGVRALPTESIPQAELNEFFGMPVETTGPLASVSIPYLLDPSRIVRDRAQEYLRRGVLNTLLEETFGEAMSSKLIVMPQEPEIESHEEAEEEAEEVSEAEEHSSPTLSQPIPIPQRRGFFAYWFG